MQISLYVSITVPQQLTHLSLQILKDEALDLAFLQVIVDHLILQTESKHASAALLSSKALRSEVSKCNLLVPTRSIPFCTCLCCTTWTLYGEAAEYVLPSAAW